MSDIGAAGAASGGGGLQQVLALRRQVADQSDALRGLRESGAAGSIGGGAQAIAPTQQSTEIGGGFADTLRSTLDQVSATQNRAGALSAAYERGEVTDVAQVMLARQEAGVAFEATLQVRNKLLSAYQEIMRMGV